MKNLICYAQLGACVLAAGFQLPAVAATAPAKPVVYQAQPKDAQVLLGSQSNPTQILMSPPLPKGVYLVTTQVGTVVAKANNVVCATELVSIGGNDGIFGGAGNQAASKPFAYGSAVTTDTFTVTTAGDQLSVSCNVSGNAANGTYVSNASLTALAVGSVVQ